MALTVKRTGFGQVEPNHLSAQRTGQIYAQLPATGMNKLENGQFVKYDLANGKVDLTGNGEWMLVFNEIKLYDERKQQYKDFAMLSTDAVNGEIVPRVFKTNIGDIYTTNCVGAANASSDATYAGISLAKKDLLIVDTNTGFLKKGAATLSAETADMVWEVVSDDNYTMADGQPAIKIVRVK